VNGTKNSPIEAVKDLSAQASSILLSAEGCDFYTLDGLKDYQTPLDHNLLGNGLLRRGAGCLLTGGTGIGKSVLAEQISVAVAGGDKLLGRIPVCAAVRVLHIEAENDAETLKRDFCSITTNTGAQHTTVNQNLKIVHAYALAGEMFPHWLDVMMAEYKPDLVVIDPYQAFVGAIDINNTMGFLGWISPVQKTIQQHNAALLLVAHTTKPRDRESWNPRESVYMAAGTSAISNWARTSMELCTVGQETNRFLLRFGKNAERNGLQDEAGRVVRKLYLEHSGQIHAPYWRVSKDQAPQINSEYLDPVRAHYEKNPEASLRDVAKAVGCGKDTVQKIKTRLAL